MFAQKFKAYLALIGESFVEHMEAAEKNQQGLITDDMFIVNAAENDGEEDEIDEKRKATVKETSLVTHINDLRRGRAGHSSRPADQRLRHVPSID